MKPMIHFAHGNGFPSPCYQQIFKQLEDSFDYCYIDRIGHDDEFPVTNNWHELVEEIIQSIKSQSDKPVIAVGHSLGGVLSFRAAVEEPDLFKALILLDAPILGRIKSNLLRLTKKLGLVDRVTPALLSKGRRHYWESREEIIEYLKSRPLFKNFDEACLNDYIDYGMIKKEKGYTLRFDRQIEYQIYRTVPHILYQYEGKLTVPTALIYGDQSTLIDDTDLRVMKKKHKILCRQTKGTHLFPMEYPKETADWIRTAIDELA